MRPDERLRKRKIVIPEASQLYDKLLSIYKTKSDNLTKAHKTRMKVQSMSQNLMYWFNND